MLVDLLKDFLAHTRGFIKGFPIAHTRGFIKGLPIAHTREFIKGGFLRGPHNLFSWNC